MGLKEHVQVVQEFRRALEQTFVRSARMRPRTRLFRELEPQVQKQFQEFREGMQRVERYLRKSELPDLLKGCGKARAALETIFQLSQKLQAEEESFPTFSESPAVQEVATLVAAVERHELGMDVAATRLAAIAPNFKRLEEDLAMARRSKIGHEEMEALLPKLVSGARQLRELTDRLEAACRSANAWELPALRENFVVTGDKMLARHKRWMALLTPDVVCPRCQVSSPAGSKICTGCQAVLPQQTGAPASTFSVEAGGSPGSRPRLAYIHQVESAIEAHKNQETSLSDLGATVQWFAGRVRQGRQNLANVSPPSRFESPEAEEKARQIRAQIESSSNSLLAGVEALERYLQAQEADELSLAVDRLLAGEAEMIDAQERMRS